MGIKGREMVIELALVNRLVVYMYTKAGSWLSPRMVGKSVGAISEMVRY